MSPNITIKYYEGCLVEIDCDKKLIYRVIIRDNNQVYFDKISNQRYNYLEKSYFIDYVVEVYYKDSLIFQDKINLQDKYVKITCPSKSLGDNLAFIGQIDKFQKKHGCKLYLDYSWSNLFGDNYSNITFSNNRLDKKCESFFCGVPIFGKNTCDCWYATYNISFHFDWINKAPSNPKFGSLMKAASDQLGLDYEEIKPLIKINKPQKSHKKKYVCIAIQSTSQCKYWTYPDGWEIICKYLKERGYDILCIDKSPNSESELFNCTVPSSSIDKTGNIDIQERITDILNCDFFIGLGSGLSWLAWSLDKSVIMISGFSNPISEFKNDYRVFNPNVCNSCYNDEDFFFVDWGYCMRNKNFECSKEITPDMVIEKINLLINNKA